MAELTVAALAVIAVSFGTSAGSKLRGGPAYRMFRGGLAEAAILPGQLVPSVAAALVAAEAMAGGLAIAALALTVSGHDVVALDAAALSCGALLSALLTAGVAVVVARGTRARCPCFGGSASRPLGLVHLTRNVALLTIPALGLAAAVVASGQQGGASAAVAAAAGALIGLLLVRFEDVADLFRGPPAAAPAVTPAPVTAPRVTPSRVTPSRVRTPSGGQGPRAESWR